MLEVLIFLFQQRFLIDKIVPVALQVLLIRRVKIYRGLRPRLQIICVKCQRQPLSGSQQSMQETIFFKTRLNFAKKTCVGGAIRQNQILS